MTQSTLQEIMINKNYPQQKMAKKLNLSESHVSLLISGNRRMSIDYAAVFARELEITLDEVFLAVNFAKSKGANLK